MRRPYVLKCRQHGSLRSRIAFFELVKKLAHLFSLQVFLGSAEIARKDREVFFCRVDNDVVFGAIRKRAYDDVACLSDKFGRHGGELPGEHQVEEERLKDVVTVMAEGDLCTAELTCNAVEDASSQSRTERTVGFSLGNLVDHNRVGVFLDHAKVVTFVGHVLAQKVARVTWVTLIDIHDRQMKLDGSFALRGA